MDTNALQKVLLTPNYGITLNGRSFAVYNSLIHLMEINVLLDTCTVTDGLYIIITTSISCGTGQKYTMGFHGQTGKALARIIFENNNITIVNESSNNITGMMFYIILFC